MPGPVGRLCRGSGAPCRQVFGIVQRGLEHRELPTVCRMKSNFSRRGRARSESNAWSLASARVKRVHVSRNVDVSAERPHASGPYSDFTSGSR